MTVDRLIPSRVAIASEAKELLPAQVNVQAKALSDHRKCEAMPNIYRERERNRNRDAHQPWRAWYKTARWQKLRERVIARDLYMCQRTGVLLVGKHPAPNSPVVDHITPHRGDEHLFWDETNLHTVSKSYHDSEKQKAEQLIVKGVWD